MHSGSRNLLVVLGTYIIPRPHNAPLGQSQSTLDSKFADFTCLIFFDLTIVSTFGSRPTSTCCNGSNHKACGLVAHGVMGFRQLHQPGTKKSVVSSHRPFRYEASMAQLATVGTL